MKRQSQNPIEAEEFYHVSPYSRPRIATTIGRKIQLPSQEVIVAATILYSFTNPHVYDKKDVFSPPRIALQERPDVPFHGGGLKYQEQLKREKYQEQLKRQRYHHEQLQREKHNEQLKRQIMNKAENKIMVSHTKKLTDSDCRDSQGRLLLPRTFVIDQVKPLLNEDESLEEGIDVKIYNNQLQKFDMVFRSWSGNRVYILRSDWNKFYHENGLEGGVDVDICVFRHAVTGRICLAVLRI